MAWAPSSPASRLRPRKTAAGADYIVSAVKASAGTGRLLLFPPEARLGAAPMQAVDPVDEQACRERLRLGEELLRTNTGDSASGWSWKRHAANVAINVAGGLIVAEGFGRVARLAIGQDRHRDRRGNDVLPAVEGG